MSLILLLISALVLLYLGLGGSTALVVLSGALVIGWYLDSASLASLLFGTLLFVAMLFLLVPNTFRRDWLSRALLGWVRGMLPKLSETEAEALRSGSVDWDGELFSGRPDWKRLLDAPHARLTAEEQAFLDGPVNTLCEMVDDWTITNELFDLSGQTWDYVRKQGFFGLVIPTEYGGKGFSQTAPL